MPFCSRCGKELPPRATFCMHCRTSITAPIPSRPPMPPPPVKPAHATRNILVVATLVLLIGISTIALSIPRPPVTPEIPTTPEIQESGTVSTGQPFILKFGIDGVPVKTVFDSAWFTTTHEYYEAESGFKFLVIQLTVQNMGSKEVLAFSSGDQWEVVTDRDYVYKAKYEPWLLGELNRIRPEEKKIGYVMFEIPQETNPIGVRYQKFLSISRDILLNLKGYSFPTRTVVAKEILIVESYNWPEGGTLTLRIKNQGPVTAAIDKIYIDGFLVSEEDKLVKPKSAVEVKCNDPAELSLKLWSAYTAKLVTMAGNTFESTVLYGFK